jgi:hypothetical protein
MYPAHRSVYRLHVLLQHRQRSGRESGSRGEGEFMSKLGKKKSSKEAKQKQMQQQLESLERKNKMKSGKK